MLSHRLVTYLTAPQSSGGRMDRLRRVARPALEQSIQLLRECSDWNPALKSAAGGLVYILSTIRVNAFMLPTVSCANNQLNQLRSDNLATCEDLLERVTDIARDLANQPQNSPNVTSRLARFER